MSGGGPLGLLAQEPSDQPFAFLLLSLLSSRYTLCHAVRMTEIPQGSLFCFRQASFSTTKRLHQTKWLLSERIWTNLKSPHALAPVSATFICPICFYFKLKRVYQSVVCGYSRCHVWLLWLQEENKEGALLQSRGVGVNALLRGHVLLSGIPESLSSLPPLLMSPPPYCSNFSRLLSAQTDEWGPVCVYARTPCREENVNPSPAFSLHRQRV